MNIYLAEILESIEDNKFDESNFVPDEQNWSLVKLWAKNYISKEVFPDNELIDLLYFFYIHRHLDLYDYQHYSKVTEPIREKYGISQADVINMFSDFCKLLY